MNKYKNKIGIPNLTKREYESNKIKNKKTRILPHLNIQNSHTRIKVKQKKNKQKTTLRNKIYLKKKKKKKQSIKLSIKYLPT